MRLPAQRLASWRKALAAIAAAECLAAGLLHDVAVTSAEQLPVRSYTVADGLPATWISQVLQDSKGYNWIVSGMTASRFDGYRFATYDARQELGDSIYFSSIAEGRQDRI